MSVCSCNTYFLHPILSLSVGFLKQSSEKGKMVFYQARQISHGIVCYNADMVQGTTLQFHSTWLLLFLSPNKLTIQKRF